MKETGINALACSFGTTHGLYLTKPKLDMNVLDEIKKRVDIPLVMHGGSGVSEEDYRTVIKKGIRKINYYTYMAKSGGEDIAKHFQVGSFPLKKNGKEYDIYYTIVEKDQEKPIYYHEIVGWGTAAMKKNVMKALRIFSGK